MTSEVLARRVLTIAGLLLPAAIILAFLSPTDHNGYVIGSTGKIANVLGFASVFGGWAAAIWHAAVMRPWRPKLPRWLVMILLVLGNLLATVLYYFLVVQRYRTSREPVGKDVGAV